MGIKYKTGDATKPKKLGFKFIVHIVSTKKMWGKGFVVKLGERYPEARSTYLRSHNRKLGSCQFVDVDEDLTVVNMVAQQNPTPKNIPPIRYEALETCLTEVAKEAKEMDATVHMPRIGCGLAGGTWDKVEPILEKLSEKYETKWYVYDLPKKKRGGRRRVGRGRGRDIRELINKRKGKEDKKEESESSSDTEDSSDVEGKEIVDSTSEEEDDVE